MQSSVLTVLLLSLGFTYATSAKTSKATSTCTHSTSKVTKSVSTKSHTTTSVVPSSTCTLDSLPATFKIKDNTTSTNNFYRVDAPGSNEILATTEADASVFFVASVSDGSQQNGIMTLSHNSTSNGNTTSYGAYFTGNGNLITVSPNMQSSGNIQPQALSTPCSLELLPYLDHDYIYPYKCGGALSLYNFQQVYAGCQAVKLQYTAA